MIIVFISLLFGFIIGYMAQRSRMCFIGGMRDFVLVRDTYLLKGFFGFLLSAAVFYYLADSIGGNLYGYPWYDTLNRQGVELARDFHAFAACWIPEEVLVAHQEAVKVKGISIFGGYVISYTLLATIGSGLGIGYLSTVANGCPLRQHVLAASGNKGASVYLAGFYCGAVIYTYLVAPLFSAVQR